MASTKQLFASRHVASTLSARLWKISSNAGIRTQILVPLLCLMLLSVLGSTASFIISTNTTRNELLDGQLHDDMQRVSAALSRSEQALLESAQLLAHDDRMVPLLRSDTNQASNDTLLDLDRRAFGVLVRYRLDQVLIVNAAGKPRVNIVAQSALTELAEPEQQQLLAQTQEGHVLLLPSPGEHKSWLLIARLAVPANERQSASLGTVYTVLNVSEELSRIRRDLQLPSDMQLGAKDAVVATTLSTALPLAPPAIQFSTDGIAYRAAWESVHMGTRTLDLTLLRSESTIDATISSGLRAMLISSGITLVLLALGGIWVARSITRPILRLSHVAGQVAAGDLSSKAALRQHDEIGQLGRALDQATDTISSLLHRQTQITGERQAILRSIADGVLAVDREQRIVLINPAAAVLLGLDEHWAHDQLLVELERSPDPTIGAGVRMIVELIQGLLDGEPDTPGEQRIALGPRVVHVRSAPVISGEQRNGVVVVFQDVTRAVEADRAKSEFIAMASHELRTPLTGLKGFVDLLALDSSSQFTRDQQECLDAVQRQTNNLVLLVNDLLETARLDQGGKHAERQWVAPANALEQALVSVSVQIASKRIQLQRVVPLGLPALWIDERHLHRILRNLISNAVKYTPSGGSVVLRAYMLEDAALLPAELVDLPWEHQRPESLVFEIEDNGVGIRAADQQHIFSRFFRSENPLSVEAGGTGLGLAITQALVDLHSGQIGFRSSEGHGSCFWVRLPMQLTTAIALSPIKEHV